MTFANIIVGAILIICVVAQSPLTTDPKWAYDGCYTSPPGHILDWFKNTNLTSPTIETCFTACEKRFAALGAGACYCGEVIPATLHFNPTDVNCTTSCPGKSSKACGGPIDQSTLQPSALSLYDSQTPEPVKYPGWKYDGCVEQYSSLGNLTHVATSGALTVEGCLVGCDKAGLNYIYAGLSGMSCFCADSKNVKVPTTYADAMSCSEPCLGNTQESCGGSYEDDDPAVSFYERENGTPADPKATAVHSAEIMTRTISQASPSSTGGPAESGSSGSDKGNAGVNTASSTGTATKSGATPTKSNAGVALRGFESMYSVPCFGVLSFLLGFLAAV